MYLQKINLKNKYALVTGAGKGLGRACSIALAEAGATVIALSRTPSDLNKLEKDIKKVKGKIIKVSCDVMNYEDLKQKLDKIKIIDVLVNNAGTNIPEPFEKIKQQSMNYLLDLNLKAAERVASTIHGLGLACDVTNAKSIKKSFETILLAYGGIDIVVSNAGAAWQGRIGEVDERLLRQSFELNFWGHQSTPWGHQKKVGVTNGGHQKKT